GDYILATDSSDDVLEAFTCTIRGKVESDRSYCGPLGNFFEIPNFPLEEAHYVLSLSPSEDPERAAGFYDFICAMSQVESQLSPCNRSYITSYRGLPRVHMDIPVVSPVTGTISRLPMFTKSKKSRVAEYEVAQVVLEEDVDATFMVTSTCCLGRRCFDAVLLWGCLVD
ncbi:hypothetical protein BDN72DRAFT_866235, partial [Pluteus cervinus]